MTAFLIWTDPLNNYIFLHSMVILYKNLVLDVIVGIYFPPRFLCLRETIGMQRAFASQTSAGCEHYPVAQAWRKPQEAHLNALAMQVSQLFG